jgi:rhamnogalacturonyl hydrolase YesR
LGQVRDPELQRIAERASTYLVKSRSPNGGWVWNARNGDAAQNYGGLVAESLLAAYEQSGQKIYLDAARDYAGTLAARFKAQPQSLPYKPDIELLVRLTEVTGEPSYDQLARSWFKNLMKLSPTGDQEVSRIIAGRGGDRDLTGYDIALGIRAALAVEEVEYARALADRVWARQSEWLQKPTSTYGTISRAALLDALGMVDVKAYQKPIAALTQALLAEQTANGSWCTNETQATAYAVRALAQSKSGAGAARKGSRWLSASLLERGAWAHFNDGMPEPFVGDVISEVQAEALTAVILASRL